MRKCGFIQLCSVQSDAFRIDIFFVNESLSSNAEKIYCKKRKAGLFYSNNGKKFVDPAR